MKKVAVTYFEPFGGRTTNASKEVVTALKDYETYELPVSWNQVVLQLKAIFKQKPDCLFMVGEAGSYREITIEKCAHNLANGIDNDNIEKSNTAIIPFAFDCIETQFDLSSVPFCISENAGQYLCNYSYYNALMLADNTKVIFIHLPYIEKEGPNSLVNLEKQLNQIIDILTKE